MREDRVSRSERPACLAVLVKLGWGPARKPVKVGCREVVRVPEGDVLSIPLYSIYCNMLPEGTHNVPLVSRRDTPDPATAASQAQRNTAPELRGSLQGGSPAGQ